VSRFRVVPFLLLSLFFVSCDQEASSPGAAAEVPTVDAPQPQRGTYTFVKTQDGGSERPVAWDPCEPIEYYVNDALEPGDADGLIVEGIAEISSVTGLEFQHLGSTDRKPWTEQEELRPTHEPVVIGWATPRSLPALSGRTAGVAWSRWDRNEAAQELHYVTGQMVLDAPQFRRLLHQPDGRAEARAIVLHELGHLVGLLHVDDPGELMHSENVGRLNWGPGDREGLAALGAGTCFGG
jgi:hypothetical protein